MPLASGRANPLNRNIQRFVYGSPRFRFVNGSLAAGESEIINFSSRDSNADKYLPFDSIIVANRNSTIDVEIQLNERTDLREIVFNKTKYSEFSLPYGLLSLKLTNLDSSSSLSAEDVVIFCFVSEINEDKLLRFNQARVYGKEVLEFPKKTFGGLFGGV